MLAQVKRVPWLLILATSAALPLCSCSKGESAAAAVETKPAAEAASSAKAGWLTSYEKAQAEAKAGHKLMLMDFTGSDWCGWCIMLDKEVFSKPAFQDYARKNLILLELDFPRGKELSSEIRAQNERLARQYEIQGFPTIVVLNGNGKTVGMLGYTPGGPEAFIAELEKIPKE